MKDTITHVVYGGAFDPPTKAHFNIIKELLSEYGTGHAIHIMVTDNDEKKYRAPIHDRVQMVEIGISAMAGILWPGDSYKMLNQIPYTVEVQKSRMAETIREMWPDSHVILVVGEDERSLLVDHRAWVDSDWLVDNCEIRTFPRNDNISS